MLEKILIKSADDKVYKRLIIDHKLKQTLESISLEIGSTRKYPDNREMTRLPPSELEKRNVCIRVDGMSETCAGSSLGT